MPILGRSASHAGAYERHGKRIASTGFVLFEIADGKIVRSTLETARTEAPPGFAPPPVHVK